MSLISQTQWHGNPRPFASYQISALDASNNLRYFASRDPYSEAGAALTTTGVGVRAPFGEVEFFGVIKEGDSVSINWITYDSEGAEIATRGASGVFPYDCSATEAAKLFCKFVNGNIDTQAGPAANVAKIYPVGIAKGGEINTGQIVYTPAP